MDYPIIKLDSPPGVQFYDIEGTIGLVGGLRRARTILEDREFISDTIGKAYGINVGNINKVTFQRRQQGYIQQIFKVDVDSKRQKYTFGLSISQGNHNHELEQENDDLVRADYEALSRISSEAEARGLENIVVKPYLLNNVESGYTMEWLDKFEIWSVVCPRWIKRSTTGVIELNDNLFTLIFNTSDKRADHFNRIAVPMPIVISQDPGIRTEHDAAHDYSYHFTYQLARSLRIVNLLSGGYIPRNFNLSAGDVIGFPPKIGGLIDYKLTLCTLRGGLEYIGITNFSDWYSEMPIDLNYLRLTLLHPNLPVLCVPEFIKHTSLVEGNAVDNGIRDADKTLKDLLR